MADSQQSPETEREAQVVAEHLPSGYFATFDGALPEDDTVAAASSSAPDLTSQTGTEGESSLKLQGGDIHRDLFKKAARAKMHKRAATFHHPDTHWDEDSESLAVHEQLAPGGARRAFIQQRQQGQFIAARMPVTRNFVEFLDLYGSFAGEDLADSDDEAITEDETDDEVPERRPLLGRRKSSRAVRSADAGMTKTFFTLLKAFIGTGIMFLPKAFQNGGILFSSIAMVLTSALTMLAFHLLLACKTRYGGGYGEIGNAIAGQRMRGVILGSITLSQLGFVCAGIVFVAENLDTFLRAVVRGTSPMSTVGLVIIQLVLLIPLSLIRNISKLGPAALIADVCILVGLTYIYYYDIASLVSDGINKSVVLFNPDRYTMTIGAAIFTYEGIGLILPIQSSMAKPERFEWLLGAIMLIITVLFTSVGALCYATFGENTSIEIINNYPQTSKLVNAIQFLYALAVLIGTPIQLFPALRIIEGKVFGHRSGKKSMRTKWIKNAFRTALVIICGAVSVAGAGNLDRFVSLIGSVACVPLVYIYPAYLHYHGIANTPKEKFIDIALMVLGLVGMVYTTTITVINSFLH